MNCPCSVIPDFLYKDLKIKIIYFTFYDFILKHRYDSNFADIT